ncbi:MAG: rRNA maturation RNase YbeY [Erysipelotrichia bacterium]|nr:rRNA maturation RNase YbeY [Erysipelotrichia bacterium]
MELNVYNRSRRKGYSNYKKIFGIIMRKTIAVLNLNDNISVSVIFVSDKKIKEINRDYRNIDRPTDVISFALADNKTENDYFAEELGDIFINVDAAIRQAKEYEHSEKREICFLFTHGLLHLNGFDHQTAEEEKKMIKYQKEILDDIVSENDKGEDYGSTTTN